MLFVIYIDPYIVFKVVIRHKIKTEKPTKYIGMFQSQSLNPELLHGRNSSYQAMLYSAFFSIFPKVDTQPNMGFFSEMIDQNK